MRIHRNTSMSEMQEFTNDCEMCGACCRRGSGFATQEDLANIAEYFDVSVDELKEQKFDAVTLFGTTMHRPKLIKEKDGDHHGQCIFLNDKTNACKIHDIKPLQCKVVRGKGPKANISFDWFMVNYFVDLDKPHSIREWAIRQDINPTELEGASVEELVPDKEIRDKIFNYEYERRVNKNE